MTKKNKPAHTLHKGQVVTVTIASLAPEGAGVSRDLELPVFVNRVAPGDLVEVDLFDVRKDFARGKVLKVLTPSEQRAEPPCKLFKVCGGCQWQHLGYQWQLQNKEYIVRQAIERIGGLNPELVKPVIGAHQPLFYRNKVQFPTANPNGSMRMLAGYYQQDSHDLVNIKHCPVQPEPLDRMLEAVKTALEQQVIAAYDEKTGTGLLRHINARISFYDSSILVTLVVNGKEEELDLEPFRRVAVEVMENVPEIKGVCLNFNPSLGNRILGPRTISLEGADFIIERLKSNRDDCPEKLRQGLQFRLSPTSFFQVNTVQAVQLLEKVLDAVLDVGEKPLVLDAYAGVGTIAMWLSVVADQVIAVEEFVQSVQDGGHNLTLNGISNVEFHAGSVEKVAEEMLQLGIKPDVIVVDPPRKGVSPIALTGLIALCARRIIYVSCNPTTLARDLKILERSGYKTREVQPIDMFPQTFHIETVTVLDHVST